MSYQLTDLYTSRHKEMMETLKSKDYPSKGAWKDIIADARKEASEKGFNMNKYQASIAIRQQVASHRSKGTKAAETMITGAGGAVPNSGSGAVPADVAKRVGALEMLRHLWLLKKTGSHEVWVLSLPESYKDWPIAALAGKDYAGMSTMLNDNSSHFSYTNRWRLSNATQGGLWWIQRAMVVANAPDTAKHKAILNRWFADANTTDADIKTYAGTLSTGLKKMAKVIKSHFLLFTDMPLDRDKESEKNTNAFVFPTGDAMSVVYCACAFFKGGDTFEGMKNWTRIVVHELSHREGKTDDHRYRHHANGLKPVAGTAFTAAKAIDNADSWALFCMDAAGQLTKSDYQKVKVA